MSDPLGQGTMPEKPAFSGPEGYGATTISVQSYGVQKPELVEEQAPHVLKGVSVGTFVPKNQPTIDSVSYVLPPNKLEPRPRKVGAEVRNPAMEELIRLGRYAKQGGITFDVDDQGNVESVNLPPELASDEEALRLELMQQKVEADILKKLFPLSLLFTENDKDADFLKPKLQNPATVAVIESLSQKLSGLIQEVHAKPDGAKLDEIREALVDFKKAVERARTEASRIPVPPPTPAPTAPPATPAPTAAPTPESLREFSGWPESQIYRRKAARKEPAGLFSTKKGDLLDEQEAWTHEKAAFDAIFKSYLDFIKNLTRDERNLVRPLIELKNRLIDAIKDEDLNEVSALREELEKSIAINKEKVSMLRSVSELTESFVKERESARKLPGNLKQNVEQTEAKVVDALQSAKASSEEGTFTKEDIEKLASAVEAYKKEIEYYRENTYKPKRVDPVLRDAKINGAWTPSTSVSPARKLAGVLRPIIKTDKNKDQEIFTRENGKMTVGEYAAQLEQEKGEDNMVKLSAAELADWPELVKAGYALNSRVNKEWFAKFQIAMKYRRMLEKDEKTFLSLYVTPSENPDTHEILYTATENLRKHPEKNIIKEVLEEKGITFVEKTRTERREDERKEVESERLNMTMHGMVYNPSKDKSSAKVEVKTTDTDENESFFTKRMGTSNYGGMETKKEWSKRITKINEKGEYKKETMATPVEDAHVLGRAYESLRGKRLEVLSDAVNYRFDKVEHELERMLFELRNDKNNENLLKEFKDEFEKYKKEVTPLIEAYESQHVDQFDQEKKRETLKKVSDILGARENWFTKKKKNTVLGARWQYWWAAGLVSAGTLTAAAMLDKQHPGEDELAREWGVPTTIAKEGEASGPTAKVETLEDWRNYVLDQRFAKNLITLPDNEFIRREAAGIMDMEKHDNIEKILNIEGYKLINDGDAYPELGKEKGGERDKLCDFVRKLENLAQNVEAPKKDLARRTGALYNGPNDTIMTPEITIRQYIGMLKKKIADADTLRQA